MDIDKISNFLMIVASDYDKSYFLPENGIQFRGVVGDYLNGYENKEIRDFLIELHQKGALVEVDIEDTERISEIMEGFEKKYQTKEKSNGICPVCNAKNDIGANFCSQCGHMFKKSEKRCPCCKNIISPNQKYCPSCGFNIVNKLDKSQLETKLTDELITLVEKDSDSEIQELIGDRFFEKKEVKKAFSWYRKSASQGNLSAQCKMASIYGSEKNWEEAYSWYEKAANAGYPEGQYQLGIRYYCGEGCPKEKKKAFFWTMKAAKQNHGLAQFHIGDSYFYGKNGEQVDYSKAFEWLDKAAHNVDSGRCFFLLGECFLEGYGTSEDQKKAFKYYKKSAETGYLLGKAKVAKCYKEGNGIDMDEEKAFEIFSSLRYEKVPAWVLYELGDMYFYGKGCSEDEEEGVGLWEKAAEKGNLDAQNELDDLEDGEGTYYDDDESAYAKQGSSSEIEINGSWSWELEDGEFTIKLDEIKNTSHWETGELKLILWYADEPYSGGHLNGEEMGEVYLTSGLSRFDSLEDLSEDFICTGNPLSGDYYNVITVNEYHEDGKWYIVGYSNGSKKLYWNYKY